MIDGLACRLANVDADVVTIWRGARLNVTPHFQHKGPDGRLLFGGQGEEIGLVSPWNNQAVPRAKREGIRERCGVLVPGEEVSAREPATKHAIHVASPIGRSRVERRGALGGARDRPCTPTEIIWTLTAGAPDGYLTGSAHLSGSGTWTAVPRVPVPALEPATGYQSARA